MEPLGQEAPICINLKVQGLPSLMIFILGALADTALRLFPSRLIA